MWILPLLGYVGVVLGFMFLTLAIASGLYYLSELVEEHTVLAKKLLYRLIYGVVGLQVLLLVVDGFPIGLSALSVVSHVVYAQNLRRFPIVKLTDPLFLLSCALVIANHYLWFRHFSVPPPSSAYSSYPYSRDANIPSFTEIASYFGLCVWLVPFALFVSLSASENVLPSMGSEYATGDGSSYITPGKAPDSFGSATAVPGMEGKRRARSGTNAGLAKQVVTGVREWAPHPDPPTLVNLPPHFHPILVDRLVNFIYTSEYDFHPTNKETIDLAATNFNFYNATFIPPDASSSPTVTALMGIRNYIFHLHIYTLAESLSYPSLQLTAFSHLVTLLIKTRSLHPHDLIALVNATFAPLGTPTRICSDADNVLQTLVVAAVILHEAKDWSFTPEYMHEFTHALQAPEYAGFWNMYEKVKQENADVLKKTKARRAAEERQAVRVAREKNAVTAPRSPRKGKDGGISKSERGKKRVEGQGRGKWEEEG
ncbi:transmembrane adaptor Erv26-domain-containing protein [Paraphoma chrysanthemicola]|uniref:Transmembrane adaptor Erv26-domain-containing protein n=1 Tax=Paraphoma chrysanthemicola TaxID=798071 RepID=A0A8K0VV49_9PLEO|nr:transmembrane adaptor Erv26-domain-containing protein [Paraphoma chrysanthemicola]